MQANAPAIAQPRLLTRRSQQRQQQNQHRDGAERRGGAGHGARNTVVRATDWGKHARDWSQSARGTSLRAPQQRGGVCLGRAWRDGRTQLRTHLHAQHDQQRLWRSADCLACRRAKAVYNHSTHEPLQQQLTDTVASVLWQVYVRNCRCAPACSPCSPIRMYVHVYMYTCMHRRALPRGGTQV